MSWRPPAKSAPGAARGRIRQLEEPTRRPGRSTLAEGEAAPGGARDAPGAADARGAFPPCPASPRAARAGAGRRRSATPASSTPSAYGCAARSAKRGRDEARTLAWLAPDGPRRRPRAAALVEGAILAAYRFDRFSERARRPAPQGRLDRLTLAAATRRPGGRGRRGDRRRRGRQPRPRAPEPARQRGHPVRLADARRGDRRRPRARLGRGPRPRRDRDASGWAGSPPCRAGPTRSRADRAPLRGRRLRAPARARRQGGHLRLRRDLDQAVGRDARDEDGHVRRRRRARGDRRDRRARARVDVLAAIPATENMPSGPRPSPGTSSPSSTGARSRSTTPTPRGG